MKAALTLCLVIGALASIQSWAPAQPHWPDTWTAAWNEQSDFTGELRFTGGEGLFDRPNGHLVWARTNGAADFVCNSSVPLPYDTPCSHIIANNTHFLFTPNLGQCCVCCTAAQGCGMPSDDGFNNFTYTSSYQYYGIDVFQWDANVNGYEVAYLESSEWNPASRSWVGLFTQYDNYTYVWDFQANVDTSGFRLPQTCNSAGLCPGGACAYLRNQETTRLRSSRSLLKNFPIF